VRKKDDPLAGIAYAQCQWSRGVEDVSLPRPGLFVDFGIMIECPFSRIADKQQMGTIS
jgi:hypothetical protein